MELRVVPLTIRRAKELVDAWHRHNRAPQGALFAAGLEVDGEVRGAVIIGRPVARGLQDGYTAEVTRLVVDDGIPNACSMLYGAAARAAKALGYRRIYTYTLASEPGTSLRAAGWEVDGSVEARETWSTPSRPRSTVGRPTEAKVRWIKRLGG